MSKAGSPAALARELGVSEVQVGRIRRGESGLSVETAIALADFIDAPDPLQVLEEYGHDETAGRLRQIFGTPGRDKLTRAQRALLKDVASISPSDWRSLRAVIRSMADSARKLK